MEATDKVVIMHVLNLAFAHGVPAVIGIIEALDKDTITVEDIEKLGETMQDTDELRNTPAGVFS